MNKIYINNIPCPDTTLTAMQNYTHNYQYDALGNMLQMQSVGNWTRNYVYNNPMTNNYLIGHGSGTVYTYDAHGNMITMPHLTSMGWDYLDQLHSAANGTFTSYYNYDAEGKRSRKVVLKNNIREERYYIGDYEVYRKYINNTLDTERNTLNISDDEKRFAIIDTLIVENGEELDPYQVTIRYQYDNHLGSACLELDDTGQIISYEEYHPFGTTSYRSGRSQTEVSLKRYKYCGKERDEETGLYYYGMRYYAAWICRFVSVDPLQFKYPHYTPYQYAGNKPISYIDLDGGEEDSLQKSKQGALYINSKGETLGEIAGDPSLERNIIVIFDENVLNAIQENENFDFSSITEEQSFTLPPYEMRQAIWNEIQNAGYSTDSLGNLIADFEIGGFIQFYNEYKNETQLIGSGYVNRMRITGNKVKDNFSNAGLSQDIDKERDPIAIANNSGKRDLADYGIASYSWHVHLNVFFDDAGIKRSYQWLQRQGQMDTSTSIGKSYSGERTSKPSDPDIKNIGIKAKIGIVIDMVGGVHLYNKQNTVSLSEDFFFSIK